jgi:hypothetical protein
MSDLAHKKMDQMDEKTRKRIKLLERCNLIFWLCLIVPLALLILVFYFEQPSRSPNEYAAIYVLFVFPLSSLPRLIFTFIGCWQYMRLVRNKVVLESNILIIALRALILLYDLAMGYMVLLFISGMVFVWIRDM